MPDLRTAKLAETLVNYCTSVRPGDWVLVRSHVAALPLAEQVLEQVAKAGGNPTVQLYSEDLDEPFLRHASLEQLAAQRRRQPSLGGHALPLPRLCPGGRHEFERV